jgi:uncharacterized protein (DUF1697 family)
MAVRVALLRGINVGGRRSLPMAELVRGLQSLGLHGVRTYVQSGNAVFRSNTTSTTGLAGKIEAVIQETRGFRPQVLVLRPEELNAAIEANPFPEAADDPKTLHLFFLSEPPVAPDLSNLASSKSATERFHLDRRVLYLHAPGGIGRSKLAARVERCLGVPATARNWRTVLELARLAQQVAAE